MNTVHEKRTPTICCLSTLSLTITFAIGIDISFFSQISVLFSSQNDYKILVSLIQEKPQEFMMNNVIKHWMAFVNGVI